MYNENLILKGGIHMNTAALIVVFGAIIGIFVALFGHKDKKK